MVRKYIAKPCVIEAIKWTGINFDDVRKFVGEAMEYCIHDAGWKAGAVPLAIDIRINTLEGDMHCSVGDYIIKGLNGEFYPCKPDIFERKYELAPEVMEG